MKIYESISVLVFEVIFPVLYIIIMAVVIIGTLSMGTQFMNYLIGG